MFLFIRSSTNPGPRVSRIIRYFEGKDKHITYLSPYRKGDKPDPQYRNLGSLGEYDYFDGTGIPGYLKYIFGINWRIFKTIYQHRQNIKFVHFSDLEVVLFGSILCKMFGIDYVYNIHDNFFQRYKFNRIVSLGLKYVESFFISISDKTLVPASFRRSCYPRILHSKIYVFRNYPDFDVSTSFIPFVNKTISLFYGGWVSPNRSIGYYYELAEALIAKGYNIKLIVCGWGDSNYIESLANEAVQKKIEFKYLGQLSQRDAVTHLQESDVSIAYYTPNKIINIFAASNKIPEIIGSSTILITNSHTEIAKKIEPLNISLQFNNSVCEVIDELISLINEKPLLTQFIMRANKFYMTEYNPQKLSKDLQVLFSEYV